MDTFEESTLERLHRKYGEREAVYLQKEKIRELVMEKGKLISYVTELEDIIEGAKKSQTKEDYQLCIEEKLHKQKQKIKELIKENRRIKIENEKFIQKIAHFNIANTSV